MTGRAPQFRWISGVGAAALIADQVSKGLVRALLDPGLPGRDDVFFQWVLHRNTGIVGGMFRDVPIFAYLSPLFAMGVMVYLFFHLDRESKSQSTAFGLVLGGAIGNFVDRVRLGGVTDFLQFHFHFVPFDFPWKYFPAFNLADSCIVVGVALLMITWSVPARKASDDPRPV